MPQQIVSTSTFDPPAPRVVYLTTDPLAARCFLAGHLQEMQRLGYDVTLIADSGPQLDAVGKDMGVRVIGIPLPREIRIQQDWRSLWELVRIFQELQPDIVNAGTPKAGLLGMLAARWCRVPVRIYLLRGLRCETTRGIKRRVLRWCEWLAGRCAHRVVCVSHSLRRRINSEGLIPSAKSIVLEQGSSNGVQAERFVLTPHLAARASELRKRLGLDDRQRVIGFVGRLTNDKGIEDLWTAFESLSLEREDLHLLLAGECEPGDPLPHGLMRRLQEHPRVHLVGFLDDPAACYHVMDVLAFPSRREGFPNVPLEAAAAGKPAVGYYVTGTLDAIVDRETGRLVARGDVAGFTEAIRFYLDRPDRRRQHGGAAQRRVLRDFQPEKIWVAWDELYRLMLSIAGRPHPQPEVSTPQTSLPQSAGQQRNRQAA